MAKGIPLPVTVTNLDTEIGNAVKKVGTINIPVSVDPTAFKKLAQPLGRVSGLATEFEKSIAASNARVIAFGASVGIINGVQNAFASLVKTTIEVEKSLTNIAVISGKTAEELQPFSRALFEIAKTTSQSFQTASEAALEFSRQGLSLDETLKRTQDALTLTRFTSLSAAEAVDVLTAAANSFGETGITTSEILNKLVAVDTKFAVSAEDLAKGLSRAGSIAQEVGVNFDELNAIVTIAQERTARGGAVIGNAFKTIFTRIRSDETIQALQSIGIYSFDAEGRLKPVVGLLEELAGKIGTLSETKRIEVLESIASKYNINVLTALVDDLGSTTSKFREARDISAGAQNEAYQRQIEFNKTLDAVITRVTNSAAQLADTLGKIGVTDSLKSLLNFFDNILTGINDVIDSEGIGGTIAKGLISGLSGVFFKIGIPLLLAIFVKLTKDIAQFGTESLKTILGINKEVRERQALEQAVVNTLIKDQQVMATILSLSGDRAKQERYLLSVYNEQLAALQKVQSIAAGVAPALQAAGLSATSGTVRRRAAEGYLPAAEAKDVRRGVGGASPSSKVVEIPNFSFGGGKRGTMVANTSEYIVPNYAGGSGTAIFNQDMAKEYGLPPGAKKITASGGFVPASGFVPNFAAKKFNVFDRLRNVKKNADPIDEVSIEGMQKSAYLTLGDKVDPVGRFSELQTSAKQRLTDKLGEIASNAKIYTEQGKIEFVKINDKFNSKDLYGKVKAVSDKKRNKKKIEDSDIDSIVSSILPSTEGSIDEDVRASIRGDVKKTVMSNSPDPFKSGFALEDVLFKKFTGIAAAKNNRAWDLPARQSGNFKKTFGFSSEFGDIKSGTSVSSISSFIGKHINAPTGTNASRGYIPNFAELNDKGIYAGLVGETAPDNKPDFETVTRYVTPTEKGLSVYNTGIKSADSVTFDVYRVPKKNEFKLKSIREALGNTGKNLAIDLAREITGGALGNNIAEQKLEQTFNPGSLQGFANTIFEASVGALLSDKSFQDYSEQAATSLFDLNITGNSLIKKNFGIKDSVNALEVKGASTPELLNSIAEKIYKATAGGQEAFTKRGKVYIEDPGRANNKSIARAFIQDGTPFVEIKPDVFQRVKEEFNASKYKLLKNPPADYKTAASGYIPNYADPSTSLAIEKISDSSLQGKLDMAAEKAYGGFTEKRPIKAGVSKRFAAGTQNTPATLKFREALEKKGAGLEPLLNRPYGFMGLQLSTAPAGATFSISDPESVRKFNNPFPTEPEASRKPALVAVANYREPTRDEIKKGVKPDVVAPQGQYANVSYATMFGAPVQLPALGVKSPAKKASFGYVPNFADLFVDYDHTIFTEQLGKVDEFNNQRALIKEVTEEEAKGMTKEELNARKEVRSAAVKKQKDLLTPFGRKLLESGKPFKLVTSRWNDYKTGITSSLLGLGFKIRGEEDVFALGREFSEENYKIDNPKFAEEMKKPEGERNKRIKPKIEPLAPQKKALFFKERAPQMATGDIDFVDNDPANLQAVKSLMPKINTFTPDQYMAKLLAPQQVKGAKASLGYVPNFADNDPLKEAIGREVAAGVPPARVRVTQDGRLKNRDNPDGLAVINTRDEPNGKIPNDFRERGMRAAMASRGFVPNFADNDTEISVEGIFGKGSKKEKTGIEQIQKETTKLLTKLKNSEIEIDEFNAALDGLSKTFEGLKNKALVSLGQKTDAAASAAVEASNKYSKTVTEKANAIQGQKSSGSNAASSDGSKKIGGKDADDAKKIDIGKFLLLQSAVVGLTSAFQSATEQGSAMANTLEGISAVASGVSTFIAIGTSLSPKLRLIAAAVTTLASAFPLLSRAYESFKDPAQKTAEALAKLGKEAERTGKKISPEEFLAVFEQIDKTSKEKSTRETATGQISDAFMRSGVALKETDLYSIYAGLSAAGDVKQGGTIDPNILDDLISKNINESPSFLDSLSRITATEALNTPLYAFTNPFLGPRSAIDPFFDRTANTKGVNKTLQERVAQRQVENLRKPQTEKRNEKVVEAENQLLQARFNILNSIFESGQSINKTYQDNIAKINNENLALERSKAILTETAYAEKQANLERKKANEERAKSEQENLQSLRESFSALQDKGLATVFGETSLNNLQPLLKSFNQKNVNSKEFQAQFKAVTNTDFNEILPKDKEAIIAALNKARQSEIQATNEYTQKINEIARDFDNFRTETAKLIVETSFVNAILGQTKVKLENAGEEFDGAAKYIELVGLESEKVSNSFSKQILANKLSETTAYQRVSTQADLLNSESDLLQAETDSYNEEIKKKNIVALRRSNLLKLVQSERKAEEENQTAIKTIAERNSASLAAIRREAELTEQENKYFKGAVDLNAVTESLRLARAKLVQSERKAAEGNLVDIEMVGDKFKADGDSIRRKREYNEQVLKSITQEEWNQRAAQELMLATTDLAIARKKAIANLDPDNLKIATGNKIIEQTNQNLNQISAAMVEGGALTKAGVQGDYEKQANARIIARRMGGRTDLTYAESEDILKGRGETITDKLGRSGAILMDEAQSFQDIVGKSTPKLFADGMAEAMQTALNQADNLGEALRGVAMSFLKNLQSAFLQSASQQIVASILPKAAEGGYVKGYASGGLVTGGSGYKDDVPAMLSQGEYVIRKSSVEKYGAHNLSKLNSGEPPRFADGGIFLPGVRGGTAISGYKDLTAFANQRTTSGATDILSGSETNAFASLEDQSRKLSTYALMNQDDTINQEIRSAQEQAMNVIKEREAYRTAERKAFQKQVVGTLASAALSYGVGAISKGLFAPKQTEIPEIATNRELLERIPEISLPDISQKEVNIGSADSIFRSRLGQNYGQSDFTVGSKVSANEKIAESLSRTSVRAQPSPAINSSNSRDITGFYTKNNTFQPLSKPQLNQRSLRVPYDFKNPTLRSFNNFGASYRRGAYGGMIARFADGGSPTDKVPALLMDGEYVMSRKATQNYGKEFFDAINQGRAPRFASGGQVSTSEPSFAEKAAASSDSKASSATNVSININVTGGTSESQSQGDTKQDGIDYKKMSEQIKQIVITTINEEKRLGGSLRPRG